MVYKSLFFNCFIALLLPVSYCYGQQERGEQTRPLQQQETPSAGAVNRLKELRDDLDVLVHDPALAGASLGVCVQFLRTGEYIYRSNEDKALMPASNIKLLTTAAALEYLGPNFTFTTTVFLDGTLRRNGVFVGNIIIRGSGDPTFSTYFHENPMEIFERWTDAFDSLGIRTIRGSIIGDDSYFEDVPWAPGWAWDDIGLPFSAPISALSFYDNKIEVSVKPADTVGGPGYVVISPDVKGFLPKNQTRTCSPDSSMNIQLQRTILDKEVVIRGVIPKFASESEANNSSVFTGAYTINDPTMYFLTAFKETLERRSITVQGDIIRHTEAKVRKNYSALTPLCFYTSPPLSEIIAVINKTSHNFCADMLLKTIGKEVTGNGSFERGADVLRSFAARIGIAPEATSIVDGSGLSRLNLLSAKQLNTLLGTMWFSPHKDSYFASLAQPGNKGTLRNRMKNSLAEASVFAKTGTLNGTSTLSGIIISRDREPISFAFLINNSVAPPSLARNIQDLFCMRLASFSRK